MACLAVALALGTVELDKTFADDWLKRLGLSYSGGAEGASLLLGTVAGSMIAIAGTVFSMTLVALSLASSQLGPRLLRNFMRDTGNQIVLGTFVATFVYCLLVLRTIRRVDEVAFVPHLSVSFGILLATVSVGVLLYFIHHISVSIQADQVVALCRLARREMPPAYRPDSDGRLRLVVPGSSFEGILDLAFNQIRQNARSNPAVSMGRPGTSIAQAERWVPLSSRRWSAAEHHPGERRDR